VRVRRTLAMLTALALASLGVVIGSAPASAGPTPTWAVAGTVLNTGSTPAPGVEVSIYATGDASTVLADATTDVSGQYSITGIGDGTYYVSTGSSEGYVPNSSGNFDVTDADAVAPTLTLTPQGILSGSVHNYDGKSPVGVYASYYSGGAWSRVSSVGSLLPNGAFSLNAVSAQGDYSITFDSDAYSIPYFTTYFGDLAAPPDPTQSPAGLIDATQKQSIGSLNVTLAEAGYITGKATSKGSPAVGVNIDAYDSSTGAHYGAQTATSSTGAYSIKVPANTPLEVETDGAAPYDYQAYDGHNGCGCTFDPVTVKAGKTKSGINFALASIPVDILTLTLLDDGSDPASPEPFTGGVLSLYGQVPGGYKLIDSETIDGTGEAEFLVPTSGNLRLRVSFVDPTTHNTVWLPIEAYEVVDPTDLSNLSELVPPDPAVCAVPLPNLQPGDARAVLIEVTEDTTKCGPEPAVKHPSSPASPASHPGSSGVSTSDLSAATPIPTPTPTDIATPTPSASASPISTPAPTPAPIGSSAPSGGLPWWAWLLIVVGVLVLAAVGIVIFRIRT
jgi:hypothetical protein